MERSEAEQIVRDAVPEACQTCPTLIWRVPLALRGVSIDDSEAVKVAAQELAADLETDCRGMRGGLLGIKACRIGCLLNFNTTK